MRTSSLRYEGWVDLLVVRYHWSSKRAATVWSLSCTCETRACYAAAPVRFAAPPPLRIHGDTTTAYIFLYARWSGCPVNKNVNLRTTHESCAPTNWWSAAALGGFLTGGVRPDERAPKQRTRWTGVFFLFYSGQPLHLRSLLGRWRRKFNCEYACCVQFHSRNEFLEAHINTMFSVDGTLKARE